MATTKQGCAYANDSYHKIKINPRIKFVKIQDIST